MFVWHYAHVMEALSARPESLPSGETSLIYHLPDVHSNRTGFEQLGNLATATEHLFADELQLDMSQVGSFDANMAAPLGAVLARVMDDFNAVEIISISENVERVLRRNRFLTYYRYEAIEDVDRNCMPFRRLRLSDEGAFEEYIWRQLRGRGIPEMSKKASQRFKKKVFEVYQNAVTHSESDVGIFVCGEIFREQSRLDFTIADGGIGIRDSVRRYFDNDRIGSVAALRWALKPNNTTKSGPEPGGLGLDFLRHFSALNNGKIRIASRFAFYEFDCGNDTFQKMASDFPGTAVTIEINTADPGRYVLTTEVSSEEP